ncbi:hypothetical protein BN129_4431 [Cronobacter sakazakii 701]|nr:hypothetical protein BN129_4431 [Cronobacter sakazakii 701]
MTGRFHRVGDFFCHEADDDLHAGFVKANHARRAKALSHRFIHQRGIFHVQTQTRDAGIDTRQVIGAAHRRDVLTRKACCVEIFLIADVNVHTVCFAARNGQLTARRHQVEFSDSKAEHHVIDDEEHQPLRNQHVPVRRQRVTGRQHHIHQPRAEAETGNPVHRRRDKYGDTRQYRVNDIQHRRHEHKGEFQRLGNAGKERGESARHHNPQHFGFIFRTRAVVNRQRRARQAEHHNREEARLITASDTDHGFTGFDRLRAAQEIRDIVNACHVEPKHGVQGVMQPHRDQQTVKECVNARADRTELLDLLAKVNETAKHDRPDVHHDECHNNHHERRQNRDQTAAAEEGQRFRQLNSAKAVVQFGGNNPHHNAHELVFDFTEGGRHLIGRDLHNHGDSRWRAERRQHQEPDKPRQRRSAVFIF